jgi:hypothetical protein
MGKPLTIAQDARRLWLDEYKATPLNQPLSSVILPEYQRIIAREFANEPEVDPRILGSCWHFIREIAHQWRFMRDFVKVEFCDDDPTPYKNGAPHYAALREGVERTGVLKVFRSPNREHPILGYEITRLADGTWENYNSIFRAVHDFFGHLASGGHFGWNGETQAYYSHAAMFSLEARRALFSETVAQQCWYAIHKDYAPQKCVWYDECWFSPPFKA